MIDVCLTASGTNHRRIDDIAESLKRHLRLVPPQAASTKRVACLHLTDRRLPEPFRVYPDRGVLVSTWDSGELCRYTGIELDNYLLIASLLALSQWRVLQHNPLLRIEDLDHPEDVRCVFAAPRSVQDFALLLDPPTICKGCVDFYHCLGADSELIALRQVIADAAGGVPVGANLTQARW